MNKQRCIKTWVLTISLLSISCSFGLGANANINHSGFLLSRPIFVCAFNFNWNGSATALRQKPNSKRNEQVNYNLSHMCCLVPHVRVKMFDTRFQFIMFCNFSRTRFCAYINFPPSLPDIIMCLGTRDGAKEKNWNNNFRDSRVKMWGAQDVN